jgi:hypothetical protein
MSIAVLGLAGCATPGSVVFDTLRKSEPIQSIGDVAAAGKSLPLQVGQVAESRLATGDPVLKYGDNTSYYKVFAAQLAAGHAYSLTVNGYCSCFGFDKLALIPRMIVLDPHGNDLRIDSANYDITPTPFVAKLSGHLEAAETGAYYIVVTADNTAVDTPVTSHQLTAYAPTPLVTPFVVSIYSYPVGEFDVSIDPR